MLSSEEFIFVLQCHHLYSIMIAMRHRGERKYALIHIHAQYGLTNESNEYSDSDFILFHFFFSENRLESLKSQA